MPRLLLLGTVIAALLLTVSATCGGKEKATTDGGQPALVTPTAQRASPTSAPLRTPGPGDCSPCYPDVCLKVGVGDYDCAGGSGNGPNYVNGPVRVVGCDPFGLDRDGDGWGCE
jgi:hypothetical protein